MRAPSDTEEPLALLPKETVENWSEESTDYKMDSEALMMLTEDVNYRLRQLAHDGSQHMRHSGRRRITCMDVQRALKWCNFGAICSLGNNTSLCESEYVPVEDMFVVNDTPIDLDVAIDSNIQLDVEPVIPSVSSRWLLVDGRIQPHVSIEYTAAGHKRPLGSFTSVHSEYFEQAVKAILSDNDEATALIVDDLASNPNIIPVLPSLLNSINLGVRRYHHDGKKMLKLLAAFKSLLNNNFLLLQTNISLDLCLQTLYHCLLDRIQIGGHASAGILTLRHKAAHLLRYFVSNNCTAVNRLRERVEERLLAESLQGKADGMYGALYALHLFKKDANVLRHLPTLMEILESLLNNRVSCLQANMVRGLLLQMARMQVLRAQEAVMRGEHPVSDYNVFEEVFSSSLSAMLPQLSLGEYLYTPKPQATVELYPNSSTEQLLGAFYDDHPESVSLKPLKRPSTSILLSQLIKRSRLHVTACPMYDVFDICGRRVWAVKKPCMIINYGRPLKVSSGSGVVRVKGRLASVVARWGPVEKRKMKCREKRQWNDRISGASILYVL